MDKADEADANPEADPTAGLYTSRTATREGAVAALRIAKEWRERALAAEADLVEQAKAWRAELAKADAALRAEREVRAEA